MPIFDESPDFLKPQDRREDRTKDPQDFTRIVETRNRAKRKERFDPEQEKVSNVITPSTDITSLIVYRLLNRTGQAEGPNVAPEVQRDIRVMPPSQFRITQQIEGKYCTRFILSWLERPEMELWQPQYAIYTYAQQTVVKWHTGQNVDSPIWDGPLQDPTLATKSPCEVVVWGYQRQPVVFAIQTRLSNGLVSSLEAMPTCAASCDPYWTSTRTVTASYSCTIDDETILADATSGAITITLFDALQLPIGRIFRVKKIDTSANAVTVQGFNSQQIDNAASYVISTAKQSNDFQNDRVNSKWWVV